MAALLTADTAPRSVINREDARDRVRGDLGLRDSSLLTDDDLNRWFNEAQDKVARILRWFRTFDVMGTEAGVKEYALPIPVSGRCIQIEEVIYDGRQLCPTTLEELLRYDREYRRTGNGTPTLYYPRGNSGFGLHLTPDTTDSDTLTVIFVGLPPHVAADDEHFYVPHGGEDALLIYAKILASEKDVYGEGQRRLPVYQLQWKEALAELKRQTDQISERTRPVMGSAALADYGFRRVPGHTKIGQ